MSFILKKTISETFLERVRVTPALVGFRFKVDGRWVERTFRDFHEDCRAISFGLMSLGVRPADRVAILSSTRYEWSVSDMAILGARAVTVPIYPSSTASDIAYLLSHSESAVVLVENRVQLEKLHSLPGIRNVVVMDPTGVETGEDGVLSFEQLKRRGAPEESNDPLRFDRNLAAARPEDLITICYTSGTTGVPKGAMITQDNMMSVLEDCVAVYSPFVREHRESTLSFLPFSHILGKVESLAIHCFGWKQSFAEGMDKLSRNLEEERPTIIFAVPRVFEKAYERILSGLDEANVAKRRIFGRAFAASGQYHRRVWAGQRPGAVLEGARLLAQKLVLSEVTKRFGGRLRFAICGGAPLPKFLGEYFQILGIPILEGYGLTETCAPVAMNTPDRVRFGTVGRPLPEVSVKIAEDGEILIRSRKVFQGYYKAPEETAAVLDRDGWFHTGDIGLLDDEGFLHITDRKKDLIITSAGKNIAPQKIEALLKTHPLLSHVVVQGDGRNYLTALITLNQEQAIRYASEQQILFSEYSELVRNPKVISLVQKIIDHMNLQLASFETIKKFIVLAHDFTVESGELTPSLKIRRNVIAKSFKGEVDSMYQLPHGGALDSINEIS